MQSLLIKSRYYCFPRDQKALVHLFNIRRVLKAHSTKGHSHSWRTRGIAGESQSTPFSGRNKKLGSLPTMSTEVEIHTPSWGLELLQKRQWSTVVAILSEIMAPPPPNDITLGILGKMGEPVRPLTALELFP